MSSRVGFPAAVVVVVLAIFLAAAEFMSRNYLPAEHQRYAFDMYVGSRRISRDDYWYTSREFRIRQQYNTAGMRGNRDYPAEPAPGVNRIALIGDSFTEAREVEAALTWGSLLENRLDRTEILNFGVAGYSAVQSLGVYRYYASGWQPRTVIYLAVGNDWEENVSKEVKRLYGIGSGNAVEFMPLPPENWPARQGRSLLNTLHLATVGRRLFFTAVQLPAIGCNLFRWLHAGSAASASPDQPPCSGKDRRGVHSDAVSAWQTDMLYYRFLLCPREAFSETGTCGPESRGELDSMHREIMAAVVGDMTRSVRSSGGEFVIALSSVLLDWQRDQLMELARLHGAHVIDLLPEAAADYVVGKSWHWCHDGHWNGWGNYRAAEVMAAGLVAAGLAAPKDVKLRNEPDKSQ